MLRRVEPGLSRDAVPAGRVRRHQRSNQVESLGVVICRNVLVEGKASANEVAGGRENPSLQLMVHVNTLPLGRGRKLDSRS